MKVVRLPTAWQVPYSRLFWQNGLSFESPLPKTFEPFPPPPPPPAAKAAPAATTRAVATSAEMMEIADRFTFGSLWATRDRGRELRLKTIPRHIALLP